MITPSIPKTGSFPIRNRGTLRLYFFLHVNSAIQHAFFLNVGSHALSATCCAPSAVRGAVLLIPPFAEERKGALPVLMQTARALAAEHIATLLFDLPGCGDAEGDFEATPPAEFERACEAALDWLSAAFPATPLALLGVRTGALLATRLAAKRKEAVARVLWSPVSGADFVRQLLQRRMVNDMVAYGKARESRAALEERLRGGGTVDLDGYAISGPLYAWLQALAAQPASGPTLFISGGHDEKTLAACAAGCPDATRSVLRFPPFWNTVGHVDLTALVAETVAWLAPRLSQNTPLITRSFPTDSLLSTHSELVALDEAPDSIQAIWDLPAQAARAGVLFLHGWSGDRTGPHRLFTRFARQLAQDGCLCLRPDFYGRGLSDGAATDASIARMTQNAQTSLDALHKRLPAGSPVIVVAICSGCKVAVSLAAANPDLAKLLLWSAESMGSLRSASTGLRKTASALATYARKLLRPETWKKILSGKVQTSLVTQALVKHETRSAEEAQREDAVLKAFRSFRSPILFVFGGSDPDATGSSQAYSAFCQANKIPHTRHTVANAGHSYYSDEWTRELLAVSQRFIG